MSEITEAMNSVARFHWEDHSNDDLRLIQAKFQIGDGLFVVQFKQPYYNPGLWELSFVRNDILDLTGTGSAATVISTVMAITREFIHDVDPKAITFSAKNDEPSRNRLYPRLLNMLHAEFPHYVRSEPKTGRKYTSYQLERPAKPYVPPEPAPKEAEPAEPLTPEQWADLDAFMDEFEASYRR